MNLIDKTWCIMVLLICAGKLIVKSTTSEKINSEVEFYFIWFLTLCSFPFRASLFVFFSIVLLGHSSKTFYIPMMIPLFAICQFILAYFLACFFVLLAFLCINLPSVLYFFFSFFVFCFFGFFGCTERLARSQFPDQGLNPGARQWKRQVLTTGLPGNSQPSVL